MIKRTELILHLLEKEFDRGGIDGTSDWYYALGMDYKGELVLVIPCMDGSYLASSFNENEYGGVGKNYEVHWI